MTEFLSLDVLRAHLAGGQMDTLFCDFGSGGHDGRPGREVLRAFWEIGPGGKPICQWRMVSVAR